jgi:hypothetical protein
MTLMWREAHSSLLLACGASAAGQSVPAYVNSKGQTVPRPRTARSCPRVLPRNAETALTPSARADAERVPTIVNDPHFLNLFYPLREVLQRDRMAICPRGLGIHDPNWPVDAPGLVK